MLHTEQEPLDSCLSRVTIIPQQAAEYLVLSSDQTSEGTEEHIEKAS